MTSMSMKGFDQEAFLLEIKHILRESLSLYRPGMGKAYGFPEYEHLERYWAKPLWWMSFVDEKFLGGCFVHGADVQEALAFTHILKINPGGEVQVQRVPSDDVFCNMSQWHHRLLTREQISEMDEARAKANEWEEDALDLGYAPTTLEKDKSGPNE